ncbi:PepSY-associated TM helix domain-containing protein [Dyadobacter pollutisoli]|uniref:PepSY-associated TM helix domain-containing protein n=1 Tax=Dyadobacter pollutisoli TaxID=2910158 RepID=A0A9E8SKZ0_9BACT|nr:PepSY-associated TM helix domain-containing protein [Dyadobacter pollutisoli]WAC13035.1 PepSY-associated TM helix domain-containing protein [Dyadobacter pollutisoli]
MKLKGLSPRLYNITFNTHTISGIVISFALYVIFFAGAFTLFKDEFYQWENPAARHTLLQPVNYDQMLSSLKKSTPQFDLSEDITIVTESIERPLVKVYGHLMVPKGKPEQHYYTTYSVATGEFFKDEKTTVGETLYRLHFFDQIPLIGRYLSGFVALFFAFAVITGVMIHWQNMLTKFHGFSLKGSLKNLWTNAHTVFGLLGLPFQLMYAITGAYYMLSFLVLLPVVMVFYGGNQEKAINDIFSERAMEVSETSPFNTNNVGVTGILEKLKSNHPELDLHYFQIKHYDREDGIVSASLENSKTFAGDGSVAVRLKDGELISDKLPGKKTYAESVLFGISRLHFATFGGLALKTIYFLLALFTCFVIISGVLLWKEARNKKSYTDKQKQFHHRVTMWYLAISFGLFPATAILFSAELLIPGVENHVFLVRTVFFVSWLVLSVAGLLLKTESRITWFYLLAGGLFSLLVPVANGFATGDWIFAAWSQGIYYTALTDAFWAGTGIISLVLTMSIGRNFNRSSAEIHDNTRSRRNATKALKLN